MKSTISRVYPFALRIADDLKVRLQTAAKESGKSLTQEIIKRLERSFDRPLHQYTDGEMIDEMMRRHPKGHVYVRIGAPGTEDK